MNKDKKILIVDDQEVSLSMAEYIISTEYTTVTAMSGPEAIKIYAKERPDMVLSDLRMPGMTGFELQLTLQGQYHEQIPFMFMTADADDETESLGFKNGAMDFIRKPFNPDILLRRIANILDTIEKIHGLKRAAVADPMTGLLNKASSKVEISALCQDGNGVLMIIDLDSFKPVNDLYGHSMGDAILIEFADIIRSAVRSTDVVGRIGGDEFVAYCQNIRSEDVIKGKAEYINKRIVEAAYRNMGADMQIPIGASIGCVKVPEEGNDYTILFQKADRALYNVKQNGKHGYAFYKDPSQEDDSKEEAVSDLRKLMTVLNERSRNRGAMLLPWESFQTIYQYLSRMVANYNTTAWILLFKLQAKGEIHYSKAEASEMLTDIIRSSLRLSDIVSTNRSGQCLVLLMESPRPSINVVTDRITRNWETGEAGDEYSLSFEIESIE